MSGSLISLVLLHVLAPHSALEAREVLSEHRGPQDESGTGLPRDAPDLIDEQHVLLLAPVSHLVAVPLRALVIICDGAREAIG